MGGAQGGRETESQHGEACGKQGGARVQSGQKSDGGGDRGEPTSEARVHVRTAVCYVATLANTQEKVGEREGGGETTRHRGAETASGRSDGGE